MHYETSIWTPDELYFFSVGPHSEWLEEAYRCHLPIAMTAAIGSSEFPIPLMVVGSYLDTVWVTQWLYLIYFFYVFHTDLLDYTLHWFLSHYSFTHYLLELILALHFVINKMRSCYSCQGDCILFRRVIFLHSVRNLTFWICSG